MTPSDAAATVLHAISCKCDGYATTPLHESFYLDKADEFLSALPPGWRLRGPDDVTVTVDGLAEAMQRAVDRVPIVRLSGPWRDPSDPTDQRHYWKALLGTSIDHSLYGRGEGDTPEAAILAALSADKEGQK